MSLTNQTALLLTTYSRILFQLLMPHDETHMAVCSRAKNHAPTHAGLIESTSRDNSNPIPPLALSLPEELCATVDAEISGFSVMFNV